MSHFAYVMKANDLEPALDLLLTSNGAPVDLSGTSEIKFKLTNIETNVRTTDRTVVADTDQVTNKGRLDLSSMAWQAGETDTPGIWRIEFQCIWSGGRAITFPQGGYKVEPYVYVVFLPDTEWFHANQYT